MLRSLLIAKEPINSSLASAGPVKVAGGQYGAVSTDTGMRGTAGGRYGWAWVGYGSVLGRLWVAAAR